MDFKDFLAKEGEKPLDNLVQSGGFCSIFRNIACIGDSLSSGEHEGTDENGNKTYHDFYEDSWGQYMAREAGVKVYNFSRGGMTAENYNKYFADDKGFWSKDILCKAYILALGVNDVLNQGQELGSIRDINLDNYKENAETFAGHYAKIIQRIKSMQPEAKFFLVTIPRGIWWKDKEELKVKHAELLKDMAELFDNTYVIDLNKYAPEFDEEFVENFALGGHLNSMGYMLIAKMVMSYIDYIIRHNRQDFLQVGFIGTGQYNKFYPR